MPFNELEEHIEPLLRSQTRVERVVSAICLFEALEYLYRSLHVADSNMRRQLTRRRTSVCSSRS